MAPLRALCWACLPPPPTHLQVHMLHEHDVAHVLAAAVHTIIIGIFGIGSVTGGGALGAAPAHAAALWQQRQHRDVSKQVRRGRISC